MTVSVVTTAFNEAKYLPQAIESVLAQTVPVYEYVVVNDGSDDDSLDVARRYDVTVLDVSNRGQPGARNAGLIFLDSCDWVIFLDGDDWLERNFVDALLEHSGNVDAVVPAMVRHFRGRVFDPVLPRAGLTLQDMWAECGIWSCAMFRHAVLREMGGFHPATNGDCDWDLWLDFFRREYELAYCADTHYHYRVHSASFTRTKAKAMREANIDEMRRHFRWVAP